MIAIDLGSNTFRCVVIDCQSKAIIAEFERMVKSAEGLAQSGQISDAATARVIAAIKEAQSVLDFTQPVKAVTTAAMRIAKNSDAVLKSIEVATGVRFEIIDAQKEAYYTQLAVSNRLQLLQIFFEAFLLIDVGGGSTELIYSNGKDFHAMSIDVGIVTMSEKYPKKLDLIEALFSALQPMQAFVEKLKKKPDFLVSTAGTPTTIAALKQGMTVNSYEPERINGTSLSLEDLNQGLNKLLSMDEEARAKHVGVGRDTLIIAGVEIIKVIYSILGFNQSIVIDDGLREGLALDACKNKA